MTAKSAIFQKEKWVIPLQLGVTFLFFAIIEIAIELKWLNEYVLSRPSKIFFAFHRIVVEESILSYTAVTFMEVLGASLGLIFIAIPFGILLAQKKVLWQAWGDWVSALAAAPIVLLYPLFLVVFGRSPMTIIVIAFLTGFSPVVIKTVEGITNVRQVLKDVGRSFNLSAYQQFKLITLPAALPAIFLGLRLGLIYAMITVVAVEYLIDLGGLGNIVGELAERYDLPATYAAMCFVVGVSILFFAFLERLEKWLT